MSLIPYTKFYLSYPRSSIAPELINVDTLVGMGDPEQGEDEDDAKDGPDEVADGDDAGIPEKNNRIRTQNPSNLYA